ncbi:MAG: histidine phosphatase family protein [Gaiellaceae bacterium]
MTTLILARHGETDWNRDGRFQGHADPPLNDRGREQARALADAVAGERIEAIYASDLRRAHETAQIVAARKGLDVVVDPDLRERDVGEWSGLTLSEIEDRFPDELRSFREEGASIGESREALSERVVAAVRRIAEAHPGGQVLVVTHGGALRTLRHAAGGDLGAPVVRNGQVLKMAIRDDTFARLD